MKTASTKAPHEGSSASIVDIENKNRAQRMALAASYLAAQKKSPAGAAVGPEAERLRSAREWTADCLRRRGLCRKGDDLGYDPGADLCAADRALGDAILGYAFAAARASMGDPSVLASLGPQPPPTWSTTPICREVQVRPGERPGQAVVTYRCEENGVSFMIQYRPQAEGSADGWGPRNEVVTDLDRCVIDGLAPAAAIRVRVRAIGKDPGPWSAEVRVVVV
jgi:hypothetical protein